MQMSLAAADSTALQPNTPVTATVQEGEYLDYTFDLGKKYKNKPVRFTVLAATGDPDLFVSTKQAPREGSGNFMWRSAGIRDESVTILPNMSHYKENWFVSVLGYQEASTFTIEAVPLTDANFTTPLAFGDAVAGMAENHAFAYYELDTSSMKKHESITCNAWPLVGYTGMYITVNGPDGVMGYPRVECKKYSGSTGFCKEWYIPSESYKYASVNEGGADTIFIDSKGYNHNDRLIVGVYALPNAGYHAAFSLRCDVGGGEGPAEDLPLGEEVWGNVADWAYQYYHVMLDTTNMTSEPSLTITTNHYWGSTGIYVAEKGIVKNDRPTNTSYTWKTSYQEPWESQVHIAYKHFSSGCKTELKDNNPCEFFIGVQGIGDLGDSGYLVVAAVSGDSSEPVHLTLGESFGGHVEKNSFDFYDLRVDTDGATPVTVSLDLVAGDADVYINVGTPAGFFPETPTADYHFYAYLAGGSVTIEPGDSRLRIPDDAEDVHAAVRNHPCVFAANARELREGSDVVVGRDRLHVTRGEIEARDNYLMLLASDPAYGVSRPCPPLPDVVTPAVKEFNATKIARHAAHKVPLERSSSSSPRHSRFSLPLAEMLGGAYCNHCSFKVSVKGSIDGCDYLISSSAAATTVTKLASGIPVQGVAPKNNYTYYSFDVAEASQGKDVDIFFSVNVIAGDPDLFALVQDPSRPDHLPSVQDFDWARLSTGDEILHIDKSDSKYCTDCTILIGIFGFGSEDAQYSITAWTEGATPTPSLVELRNGEPQAGFVENGAGDDSTYYEFFVFTAAVDLPSETSVQLSWGVDEGAVEVFVTNKYDPSTPDLSKLPMASNKDDDMWSETNGGSSITISKSDKGFNKNTATYVIGVHGVDTDISWTSFNIVANAGDSAEELSPGRPSRGNTLSAGENKRFVFTLGILSRDVVFGVTPEYGDLVLAVTSDDLSPVSDWPTCSGADATCTHTKWRAEGGAAASLNISHNKPCTPTNPDVTITNCSDSTAFRTGMWRVDVFARSDAAFSIVANLGDDHTDLFEGTEIAGNTSDSLVCPAKDRSPDTHQCSTSSSDTKHRYLQWFRAEQPSDSKGDSVVTVSRRCDNTTGLCGPPLAVYASSCQNTGGVSGCTIGDAYPYWDSNEYEAKAASNELEARVFVPPQSCFDGKTPTPGVDCIVYIGVFSDCVEGLLGCRGGAFDIEFDVQGSGSVQQISSDCFVDGQQCVVQGVPVAPSYSLFFEGNTKNMPSSAEIDVRIDSCDSSFDLYMCKAGAGTKCTKQGVQRPSKGNADASVTTNEQGTGTLTFHSSDLQDGVFFLGAQAVGESKTLQYSSMSLNLRTGDTPTLNLPAGQETVQVAASGNEISLHWHQPSLDTSGGTGGKAISNATYIAYLLPVDPTTKKPIIGAVLTTPCGLERAYNITKGDAWGAHAQRIVVGGPAPEARFTKMPKGTYWAGVTVVCDKDSKCLPDTLPPVPIEVAFRAAEITYSPGQVSPSPVPSASPNPNPSHGGKHNPSPAPKPNGGAIAGGIIAVIAVVGLGFGGWFLYRRWQNPVPSDYDSGGFYSSSGDGYDQLTD